MADQQKTTPSTPDQTQAAQAATEPTKVEISVEPEKKPSEVPAEPQVGQDLSQLTPVILEALCFDSSNVSQQELRAQNAHLQGLLGKVIELLKEKSGLCANLEKQNNALMIQSNSLKDVVAITKDLLSIRNMEVEHLHVDIKSMEEKINYERERHNNMLNRMSEAIKLNENLKAEYQSQLGLFNDLRSRYEEKVVLLENENKRLSAVVAGNDTIPPPSTTTTNEQTGEGDVQLQMEPLSIPPP